jgi:hypothetical protein
MAEACSMIVCCRRFLASMALVLAASTAGRAASGDLDSQHWTLEAGTTDPSYAATEPVSTNLNLDAVVLGCEDDGRLRVLQLQLYTTDGSPLRPLHADRSSLRDDPKAEVDIDAQAFPATLAFADNYAVVADAEEGSVLSLSNRLLSAMQGGRTMTLRFDLVVAHGAGNAQFGSEAVVDLRASGAQDAISTLRRCARQPQRPVGDAVVAH